MLTIYSSGDARSLSLWNGSSNDDPPDGWTEPTFADGAWLDSVSAGFDPLEAVVPGSIPQWRTHDPVSATEHVLLRHHFLLPVGIINATLVLNYDDTIGGVWINGHALGVIGSGTILVPEPYGVPIDYFVLGGENILCVWGQNQEAGPAYISYALHFTTWEDNATTDGSDVANTGDYGAHLGSGTTGSGPAVRITEPSGDVDWEHDGTLFRVRSRDLTVLQAPFPDMSAQPLAFLGKDPTTGLPMWTVAALLARKQELPLDTGGQGQVPADDRTLPDDPPAPTTLQTDKPLPPVALPDPVIDNCPIMRCGAAYYLAQKLKEQYDLVRNLLLGMLAAPLLLRVQFVVGVDFGTPIIDLLLARLSNALIGQFGSDVLWLTRLLVKLSKWAKVVGVGVSIAKDFEDLGEEGNTLLQSLAYPCLTCSENIFNLSQDMLVAWELAINADTADLTDWQRHLLVYILQCTPFGVYHTVAAQGAAITSDTCGGF